MISAQDMVKLLVKKQPKKLVKFAKVDSGYVSGRPQLIFDGESVASIKQYPHLASYTPVANDRVLVINGVVIGNII